MSACMSGSGVLSSTVDVPGEVSVECTTCTCV